MGEMRILGSEGDLKVIWDSDNEDEVEAAREQFETLTGKGYLAFRVKKDGKKGVQTKKFDPDAEKLILAPPIAGG